MTARGNPSAVKVVALENHKLLVTFENGETRIFDLEPMLEGMQGKWFGELIEKDYFNTVRIGGGSVEWPHEQDICPDCLYEESVPFNRESDVSTSVS